MMAHPESNERLPQQQLKDLRLEFMALFEDEQHTQDHKNSDVNGLNLVSIAQMILSNSWQDRLGVTTVQLAQQQMKSYAKEKPFHLVGWAALLGAGLIIIKPWRYVPRGVTGFLGTALINRIYKMFSKL